MKICFCEHNKGKKKIINKLEENYSDIEVKTKKCIGKCGACSESPIAKIKDKIIIGKDSEDLYEKLAKTIEEKHI